VTDVGNELTAARVLAYMDMAVMNAGVACWHAKFAYWLLRPSRADPGISLAVGLPNFPAYTSGHSAFSARLRRCSAAAGGPRGDGGGGRDVARLWRDSLPLRQRHWLAAGTCDRRARDPRGRAPGAEARFRSIVTGLRAWAPRQSGSPASSDVQDT
jgi:hypothetical protein